MFDLNNHLDSDEKIMLFFRPSRKAYLFQYIFFVILFLLSIFILFTSFIVKNELGSLALTVLFYVFLLWSIIMLIRIEYRIWSRKYAVTTERVLYSKGIFSEEFRSTMFNYITDISLDQTLWDKIMNTGTLTIDTAGTDQQEIRYRKISDPVAVKKLINDTADKFKMHEKFKMPKQNKK